MNFMPRLYKDDDLMSLVVLWRIARAFYEKNRFVVTKLEISRRLKTNRM